jgi:hypothetical protein
MVMVMGRLKYLAESLYILYTAINKKACGIQTFHKVFSMTGLIHSLRKRTIVSMTTNELETMEMHSLSSIAN